MAHAKSANHSIEHRLRYQEALGSALAARFEQDTDLTDIEQALQLLEDSLALRTEHGLEPGPSLSSLGLAMYIHDSYIFKGPGVNRATEGCPMLRRVIQESTDATSRVSALCTLALWPTSLTSQAERVVLARQAIELAPLGHPEYVRAQFALGYSLLSSPRDPSYVTRSRECFDTLRTTAALASSINNPLLGPLLGNLYQSTIELDQFHGATSSPEQDTALVYIRGACVVLPQHHLRYPRALSAFAGRLINVYRRDGEAKVLEESLSTLRALQASFRPGTPIYMPAQQNLGEILHERFLLLGRVEDLEEAVALSGELVALVSSDQQLSVGYTFYIAGYGTLCMRRYAVVNDPADLDRAIVSFRRCLPNVDGVAVLEIGYRQAETITALAADAGLSATLRRDLGGRPRALILRQT